ncbi:hypothetical protein [Micromonospora sp. WMMD812]|uniref:hypothetical protein n=1 Tax=Micromonospora sp. WMMD812 TaxID=3015152 RepID=UPI00248D0AE4|nr:hypothetical protein [Micromonospora sp. WMMD812]WBB70013.1 hypothetical protein O7603_11900 [Micromonospora sp. WMMD812]
MTGWGGGAGRTWRGTAGGGWPGVVVALTVPALLGGSLLCLAATRSAALPVRLAGAATGAALVVAALAAGLSALAMSRLTVELTPYQVLVRHPLLRGPNAAVPLRQIRRMRAVQASARPWTVWWCPWPGCWRRTVLIRSGPALWLEPTSGRSFVVSLDDPQAAVDAFRRLR